MVARYAGEHLGDPIRIAMPSGVLSVGAEVVFENNAWRAVRGSFYRTARRLFDGAVYLRP